MEGKPGEYYTANPYVYAHIKDARKDLLTNPGLYARMGYGESMCMAYCKHYHDVIASSNITEITGYCDANGIQYITTMDFLYKAFIKNIMTEKECNEFIQNVISKGSKLLNIKITQYTARQIYM